MSYSNNSIFSTIWFYGLIGLVFLLVLNYHPFFMTEEAVEVKGTALSRYIVALFSMLWVLRINVSGWLNSKVIRISFIAVLVIFFTSLLTIIIFDTRIYDLRAILICMGAIMIGWQADLSDKKVSLLLIVYGLLSIIVGVIWVFGSGVGFSIQSYFVEQKNSFGVLLATSVVLFFYLFLQREKVWNKIILLLLVVLGFMLLLTIRARLSTLTAFLIVLLLLFRENSNKTWVLRWVRVIFIVLIIVVVLLRTSAIEYIYQSYTYEQGDDLTSDRMFRNKGAIDFLSDHLLFGNLSKEGNVVQVHNYPLRVLYEYGLFFSLPIISYYAYSLILVLRKSLKSNIRSINCIGYFLVMVPFIISFGEPTLPFGPGTATLLNFILFGYSLKCSVRTNTYY